jgi:CRP-like cAMP-binding protein
MASVDQKSFGNRLLLALQPQDLWRLQPHLEPVQLRVQEHLNVPNEPTPFVYFLDEGIGSIVIGPERTSGVEIGMVGREGLIGTSVLLGAEQSPHSSFIQLAGSGWRVPSESLLAAMSSSAPLQSLLLRYLHAYMVQLASTAYANADFTLEERLARWILMCHDRVDGDKIAITHDFIALMLGVRRPGVTVATHVLEGEGMIRAKRGLITVLDRDKLMKLADRSYGLAEAEYERLVGTTSSDPQAKLVRFPSQMAAPTSAFVTAGALQPQSLQER